MNAQIDWEKIVNYYNNIKFLYIECEETDPELKTNLQPLNEFRAALDHLMRLVAIENLDDYKEEDSSLQARKLLGHLQRAFYDICDMLSINYRNKIIDLLEPYHSDTILKAIPHYYEKIRPDIEQISDRIAQLRTDKKLNQENELDLSEEYRKIVIKLRDYYKEILDKIPSLTEIHKEFSTEKRKAKLTQIILPVIICFVGVIVGVIGWVV